MARFTSTNFSAAQNSAQNELSTTMAGLEHQTVTLSLRDTNSEMGSQSSDDSFLSNEDLGFPESGIVSMSADGWRCCKCQIFTSQDYTTCRKCGHGCCANCED